MTAPFDFEPLNDGELSHVEAASPMAARAVDEIRALRAAARARYVAIDAYLAVPHIAPHPEKVAAHARMLDADAALCALIAYIDQSKEERSNA